MGEKNNEKKKNILVVDDSALMRRVTSDIINSNPRFCVTDFANNGFEALDIIYKNYGKYDAVVCDINMPKMTGIDVLKALSRHKIDIRVVMSSTMTLPGAKETILALELGAFDFVTKPSSYLKAVNSEFGSNLMKALYGACELEEEWDLEQNLLEEQKISEEQNVYETQKEDIKEDSNLEFEFDKKQQEFIKEPEKEIISQIISRVENVTAVSKTTKEESKRASYSEAKTVSKVKSSGVKKENKKEADAVTRKDTKVSKELKELKTPKEPKASKEPKAPKETLVNLNEITAKPKKESPKEPNREAYKETKKEPKRESKKETIVELNKEAKKETKKEQKKEHKKDHNHNKDMIKPDYGMDKIVVIASSTGGPKALAKVIPKLDANIDAPIVIVQHMPEGFTSSLAARLDEISQVKVKEAVDDEPLSKGTVYIARGGRHLKIEQKGGQAVLRVYDGPAIVGLKPCADITIESCNNVDYKKMLFVVMTGMGQDGTKGLMALKNTINKKIIVQDQKSSAVYGMPRAVVNAGLTDEIFALDKIAKEINQTTGVRKHGC